MSELLQRLKENQLVSAAILLAAGVCLMIAPVASLRLVIRLAGILLLLIGAGGAFLFFSQGQRESNDIIQFIVSIVAVVLGLYAIVKPQGVLNMLGVVIGLVIILSSVRVILRLKNAGVPVGSWPMIQAIVILVVGIIFLFLPHTAVKLLARAGGIVLIVQAVTCWLGHRAVYK